MEENWDLLIGYFQQNTNAHADGHLEEGTVQHDSVTHLEASLEQNEQQFQMVVTWRRCSRRIKFQGRFRQLQTKHAERSQNSKYACLAGV